MKKMVLAAVAALALTGTAQAEGDAEKGERVFKRCTACHAVGPDAKNKVGPPLNGIVGRAAASVEGYKYGDALLAKAEEIGEWEVEELMAYLEDPGKYIDGRSKMTFKLRKEDERADVIAYLQANYGPDGNPPSN